MGAKAFRKMTRKRLELGVDDETGETLEVVIRKVRVGEVTAVVGTPPSLFAFAVDAPEGETDAQRAQRMKDLMAEDEDFGRSMTRQTLETQNAVVSLGVVSPKIVFKEEHELGDDEMRPEDLGEHFTHVHDEIIKFSSLPYQPLGGAGMAAFQEVAVSASAEPDGEILRQAPERAVEPQSGGLEPRLDVFPGGHGGPES